MQVLNLTLVDLPGITKVPVGELLLLFVAGFVLLCYGLFLI